MGMPLLATKLHIPPARPGLVPRSCLFERLDAGLDSKLTLISAPAGSGKTTLVSEWLRHTGLPVAWLALDRGDNEPAGCRPAKSHRSSWSLRTQCAHT
jgi:LuxR family maltose regulon positive regulatory protein